AHLLDSEGQIMPGDHIAGIGDAVLNLQDQRGDRAVLIYIANPQIEGVQDLPDGNVAGHQQLVLAHTLQGRLFLLQFVLDLADDLFQQILQGQHAGDAAELVNGDGQGLATTLQFAQKLAHTLGFGHKDDGARNILQSLARLAVNEGAEHVFDYNHARNVL